MLVGFVWLTDFLKCCGSGKTDALPGYCPVKTLRHSAPSLAMCLCCQLGTQGEQRRRIRRGGSKEEGSDGNTGQKRDQATMCGAVEPGLHSQVCALHTLAQFRQRQPDARRVERGT